MTASVASLLAGAMAVVGLVGGILCSSWLMKRSGAGAARMAQYTAVIAGIAACFTLFFFWCGVRHNLLLVQRVHMKAGKCNRYISFSFFV